MILVAVFIDVLDSSVLTLLCLNFMSSRGTEGRYGGTCSCCFMNFVVISWLEFMQNNPDHELYRIIWCMVKIQHMEQPTKSLVHGQVFSDSIRSHLTLSVNMFDSPEPLTERCTNHSDLRALYLASLSHSHSPPSQGHTAHQAAGGASCSCIWLQLPRPWQPIPGGHREHATAAAAGVSCD